MLEHKPTVTLQVADNRLASAGYMRRVYPHDYGVWERSEGENVYRWPGTQMVTLKPVYYQDPTEAQLASWTGAGTDASYTSVTGIWQASGSRILQQNPKATNCTLTAGFTPEANQPFYLDFYLYWVNSPTWYADFVFCSRYALRLLFTGEIVLYRNWAVGEEAANWQPVAMSKSLERLFGQHLRLTVYPTSHDELLIIPWTGGEPITYTDPDPIITTDGDFTYHTICPPQAPVLTVTSGSFYFSYRYMRFEKTGWFKLPQYALPWPYTGTYDLVYGLGDARSGHVWTADLDMYSESGVLVPNPSDSYFLEWQPSLSVNMGTDDLYSPEFNWVQLGIDPTAEAHTPTPITVTGPGQLQSLSVAAGIRSRRTVNMEINNLDGTFDALPEKLHMAAEVKDGATVIWRGYVHRVTEGRTPREWPIALEGEDPLSRLEIPLSDAYIGDGLPHTEFVDNLIKRAGLAATDYSIYLDTAALALPEAYGLELPLFQARDGRTIREMVEYVGKVWSGWELYADRAGVIWYAPGDLTSTPDLTLYGHEVGGTGQLKYFDLRRAVSDEEFANYIVAIGEAWDGEPLLAAAYDSSSIHDTGYSNYLGMEKLLLLVDSNLKTPYQVETALSYMIAYHGHPQREIEVQADWDNTLDVNQVIALDGLGSWQVRALERRWEPEARVSLRLRSIE